jgi:hypothetical protein
MIDTTAAATSPNQTWWLRPVLSYPTAYMIVIVVHEGAHALTAVALGFPSTLYNFWVNHQFTGATLAERAIVGAAGPLMNQLRKSSQTASQPIRKTHQSLLCMNASSGRDLTA